MRNIMHIGFLLFMRRRQIMILKFWTKAQYDKISEINTKHELPQEVMDEILRLLEILDKYYGSDRDVENSDGGYLLLFTENIDTRSYFVQLLNKYHVSIDDAELDDILCTSEDGSITWRSTLYLVTGDFAITFIYPCTD